LSTELVIQENRNLTAPEIQAQVQLIQQVMQAVMKDGIHYGTIPGCGDKPALLKPGAEKIASTFRFAIDPQVEDLSKNGICRYRVRALVTHQVSQIYLGAGVGEASGGETKYMWRAAECQEEYDATPADERRLKWKKWKDKAAVATMQVRMNQSDIANTVLKMAKKRALVDAVLTITGASDCFSQDLDDMDDTTREAVTEGEQRKADDKKKQDAVTEFISHAQASRCYSIAMANGFTVDTYRAALKAAGYDDDRKIPKEPKTIYDGIVAGFQKAGGK
jgi:hypothetical protein